MIPLKIFQTWYTLDLPPKMKENVNLLKRKNPEFTHYLYDDDMCREFIKQNFEEEVLYTFDKLKPGAYKADLWRYCVLYVHGGIYLDIKFNCIYKLIDLTDKEYFVKDKPMMVKGVYQAFMATLPYNRILLQAITTIVEYCKYSTYTRLTPLCVTGPGLLAHLMRHDDYITMELENMGEIIVRKGGLPLLTCYPEYRREQANSKKKHYDRMWRELDIYHYPVLTAKRAHCYTREIVKTVQDKPLLFLTETPTLLSVKDTFHIYIKWVHKHHYLHSTFIMDAKFNPISDEVFLDFHVQDLHLFNHKDVNYYLSTINNTTFSDVYDTDHFNIDKVITPTIQNQCFVPYNDNVYLVYNWYPLELGVIHDGIVEIMERKYLSDYFKGVKSSSSGCIKKDELWFLLDKTQHYFTSHTQHFFAVFDLTMNLRRYSELFKLSDSNHEKCNGLLFTNDTILIPYSIGNQCFISEYEDVNLKWY